MKIFITGASGYIGKNLVSSLVEKNIHEIGVLVRQEAQFTNNDSKIRVIKKDIGKLS